MEHNELEKYLLNQTPMESESLIQPRFLIFEGVEASLPYNRNNKPENPYHVSEGFIMAPDQKIAFSKHPRYIHVLEHYHSFIELNYVYSGSCTQYINGKKITLLQGEFCLLDTNVVHAFEPTGENDIIINCLMRKSYFNVDMLNRLAGNDILSEFFINAVYKSKEFQQYLLFPTHQNAKIHHLMNDVLCEFYDPKLCSREVVNSYIIVLFSELLRVYKDQVDNEPHPKVTKIAITDILIYLESNYRTVTLESAANHFHFHPNYLSRLLKNVLGQSFIKLLIEIKMKKACVFLENTDFPIGQIVAEIGYTNLKFFYDKFKEQYGMTPAQYRQFKHDPSPYPYTL
ncbi:AraC family transcriptional regulator [Paenibacillus psychroresistens]|uniref:AraC family transcriptional regulator n=1 Tax=Paenibacillus psychroresistens TaxID=1778678 RepID=A0A6B8RFP5_9BACL|nr:AraC family transcriptional regulator [Paenibacillus psychroresistens]QGQ94353.1 AraC family transcriptional regulator [Paenibacillus psychroresistens]